LAALAFACAGVEVRQGGFVTAGRRAPPWVRAFARLKVLAEGASSPPQQALDPHRSRLVEPAELAEATHIFYMDSGNRRRLAGLLPRGDRDERLICLATYAGETRVPDPMFLTPAARPSVLELVWTAATAAAQQLRAGTT